MTRVAMRGGVVERCLNRVMAERLKIASPSDLIKT
jgi:hypothetical protein